MYFQLRRGYRHKIYHPLPKQIRNWIKYRKRWFLRDWTSRQQSTVIPGDQKQRKPWDCPKLIPEENSRQSTGRGNPGREDSPLSWKDRTGRELKRVRIKYLVTEKSEPQREKPGLPRKSTLSLSWLLITPCMQAKEKRHTKNLEEIAFEDYIGQGIVLVPTRQNGKSPNL